MRERNRHGDGRYAPEFPGKSQVPTAAVKLPAIKNISQIDGANSVLAHVEKFEAQKNLNGRPVTLNSLASVQDIMEEFVGKIRNAVENKIVHLKGEDEQRETSSKALESLVRSQSLIKPLHHLVASAFFKAGVPLQRMLYERKLETNYDGKDVDLAIDTNGTWASGEEIIAVGCKSQIASIGKNLKNNFDAVRSEITNYHEKFANQVVGMVNIVMLREIDDEALKDNRLAWKDTGDYVEKQIRWYMQTNGRTGNNGKDQYAERMALVIVDPAPTGGGKPKVYTNVKDLIRDGFLDEEKATQGPHPLSLNKLTFEHFADDLIAVHRQRFIDKPANPPLTGDGRFQ
jgi:hypothetical protein